MPILLTGEEIEVGKTLKENLENCFNKTKMYDVLRENGYSVQLYVEKALIASNCPADNLNARVDNISTRFNTKIKIADKTYKYVLFRYLPHFLKSKFVVSSEEFNKIKSTDKSLVYKYSTYYLDDVRLNRTLTADGIETNDKMKSFKFYQLNGVHAPYTTTPDLQYNKADEYKDLTDEEKKYNECLASINFLMTLLQTPPVPKTNIFLFKTSTLLFSSIPL